MYNAFFGPKEYYLWSKVSTNSYAWARKYLNYDFLKYEQKRVQEASKWYEKFITLKRGQKAEDVTLYVIPIEINFSWLNAVNSVGNYDCMGLAALYNSPILLLPMLIPKDQQKPKEYTLVHIKNGKRENILRGRTIQPAILIEGSKDIEELPPDKIYIDIPHEKRVVQKFLQENLGIHDKHVTLSLQAPITSSPYVYGGVGGVSLMTATNNTSFGAELARTIQLMVPPEYRIIQPSDSLMKGYKFPLLPGMKFHLSERVPLQQSYRLNSLCTSSRNEIMRAVDKRTNFLGEYSIFSTLNTLYGSASEKYSRLLTDFSMNDLTLAHNIDEMFKVYDTDLQVLKGKIDEDLYLQVANTHQFNPVVRDKELQRTIDRYRQDLEVLINIPGRRGLERDFAEFTALSASGSLKRVAQSISRSKELRNVGEKELNEARKVFVDNWTEITHHPDFAVVMRNVEKDGSPIDRYQIVRLCLLKSPATSKELYEQLKDKYYFSDIQDLEGLMSWLVNKNQVIRSGDRYIWVGKS